MKINISLQVLETDFTILYILYHWKHIFISFYLSIILSWLLLQSKKLCNNAFIHVCIFITTIDQSKGCLAWEVNQPCCYDWMVSNGLQNLSHAFPCLIHVQRNHYHFQMTHDIYDTSICKGNVSLFWKWKAT